jgi:hypothetical protein
LEDSIFYYYYVDYTDLSQCSRVLQKIIVASGASKCVLLTKYCQGDHINEVEMGMACGIHGNKEVCMQDFGVKT